MNINAKILEITETQQVSGSFRKREFIVEYAENPQYPEFIKFEAIQANCDQLDRVSVGQEVNIQFNLKGRKWTDPQGVVKYFNSLQAWKVEAGQASSQESGTQPTTQAPQGNSTPGEAMDGVSFSEDDDLPF
ncbi:MAG: hypothetical protein ACI9DM_001963 [Cyclobacteriaceae bacterium]|jgi:hypothetical protein